MSSSTIKNYYTLTKPGIIYGNALTAAAGFFFASKGQIDLVLFVAMLIGVSLIIGASCVVNNYIDLEIDKKMSRTKNRALVLGTISKKNALIYAVVLGGIGLSTLLIFTNPATVCVGLIGVFFYLVMYTIWKRKSVYGTIIGSVSGATPIVAGYTAVTGTIDLGAVILFLILVFWQMPHFYSIAVFRSKEYESAAIPVLPVKQGIGTTKQHIFIYTVAFVVATILLTVFGYAGYFYLFVMLLSGGMWLFLAFQGFRTTENNRWARKMFRYSLIIILVFSAMISVTTFLP